MNSHFLVSLSAVAALASNACKPETRIAGQPVSHWIERLEDANPQTRSEAWRQLNYANTEDIKNSKRELERIANSQSAGAENAAWILFEKSDEVDIKWINFYIKELSQNSLYGGRGIKAIKKLETRDREAVVSGLNTFIADGLKKGSYPTLSHVAEAKDYLKKMNQAGN